MTRRDAGSEVTDPLQSFLLDLITSGAKFIQRPVFFCMRFLFCEMISGVSDYRRGDDRQMSWYIQEMRKYGNGFPD